MNENNTKTSTTKEQIFSLKQDLKNPEVSSDLEEKSKVFESIGRLYFSEKNYKEGTKYFENAIKLAIENKNKVLEAQFIGSKGTEYLNHGLPEEGYLCFEEVIKISKEINNLSLQCDALGSIGLVQLETGDPGLAIQKLKEALDIAEELKDSKRIMQQVGTLGNTYLYLAAHEEAEKYFERAIELAEKNGDNESFAGYLNNYAIILDSTGRKDEAINKLMKVQNLCKEIDYSFGERNALQQLIKIELESNSQDSTIIHYLNRAIELSIELKDENAINGFSDQLILVYLNQNRLNKAVDLIKNELNNSKNNYLTRRNLQLLINLGNAYYDLEKLSEALNTYTKAMELSKDLELEIYTARLYGKISAVMADQGKFKEALTNSNISLTIAKKLNNTHLIAEQLSLQAMSYRDLGQINKAIECGKKALSLYEDNDQKLHIEQVKNLLNEIKTPE